MKRRRVLEIIGLLFLFWQNIWQSLLFIRLLKIDTYSDLFAFLPDMKGYSASIYIRWIYEIITSGGSDILVSLKNLFTMMSGLEIVCILCIFLILISSKNKEAFILFIKQISIFIWTIVLVLLGFKSTSLQSVILILRVLSTGGIVLEIVCIYSILSKLRLFLIDIIKETYVSNI